MSDLETIEQKARRIEAGEHTVVDVADLVADLAAWWRTTGDDKVRSMEERLRIAHAELDALRPLVGKDPTPWHSRCVTLTEQRDELRRMLEEERTTHVETRDECIAALERAVALESERDAWAGKVVWLEDLAADALRVGLAECERLRARLAEAEGHADRWATDAHRSRSRAERAESRLAAQPPTPTPVAMPEVTIKNAAVYEIAMGGHILAIEDHWPYARQVAENLRTALAALWPSSPPQAVEAERSWFDEQLDKPEVRKVMLDAMESGPLTAKEREVVESAAALEPYIHVANGAASIWALSVRTAQLALVRLRDAVRDLRDEKTMPADTSAKTEVTPCAGDPAAVAAGKPAEVPTAAGRPAESPAVGALADGASESAPLRGSGEARRNCIPLCGDVGTTGTDMDPVCTRPLGHAGGHNDGRFAWGSNVRNWKPVPIEAPKPEGEVVRVTESDDDGWRDVCWVEGFGWTHGPLAKAIHSYINAERSRIRKEDIGACMRWYWSNHKTFPEQALAAASCAGAIEALAAAGGGER